VVERRSASRDPFSANMPARRRSAGGAAQTMETAPGEGTHKHAAICSMHCCETGAQTFSPALNGATRARRVWRDIAHISNNMNNKG
jgi:hypothetical protein